MFGWIKFVRYLNRITLQKTIACVIQKRLTGLSAEMAFHAMLGLFPAIIAVLTAIGLFEQSVESSLIKFAIYFSDIVPIQVWELLLKFIEDVKLSEGRSWFSLSSIVSIWFISGVLSAAINALDEIHQVPLPERRSFWQTKSIAILLTICTIFFLIVACFLLWIGDALLKIAMQQNWNVLLLSTWKIFSIIVIIAIFVTTLSLIYQFQTSLKRRSEQEIKSTIIGTIVIVSAILMQFVHSFLTYVQELIIHSDIESTISLIMIQIWRLLGFPIALGIVAIAFSLVYRFGTSRWEKDTPIIPGAILAAISWAIVSVLFRLYVYHMGLYNKIYGAVGTIVVLMLWLYLSSFIMLLGDQINVIVGEAMKQEKQALKNSK
ncbi:MAG: YihY/virulence factor BrkB family protein [Pleurocapsa sp.]